MNINTVDTLFKLIDFDKFKEDMIEMKKSINDTQGTSDIQVNASDALLNQNQNVDSQYLKWQELDNEDKSKW